MSTFARNFLVSGLGVILSLGLVQGCGDDEEDGTGGRGGRGGSGGAAGTAGSGGKAGTGGTGGSGGTAGSAGDSGADSGDGGRTLSCAYYCTVILANCRDERDAGADAGANNEKYPNRTACEGACNSFPVGSFSSAVGNTLACRITHAELAAPPGDTALHCGHAGQISTGICVDADAGGDASDAAHD